MKRRLNARPPMSTAENIAYRIVGLILMKFSLDNHRVRPPKISTNAHVSAGIGEILRSITNVVAIEIVIATMNTAVAVKMPETVFAAKKMSSGPRSSAILSSGDMVGR